MGAINCKSLKIIRLVPQTAIENQLVNTLKQSVIA